MGTDMKITFPKDVILVANWRGEKFRTSSKEITEVSVMADRYVPKRFWDRLLRGSSSAAVEQALRAIVLWSGDKSITLDNYYDSGLNEAVEWLSRHGWDMSAATARAKVAPLQRVVVNRKLVS